MTHENHHNEYTQAVELLIENGFEGVADSLAILLNSAMKVERANHLEANPYERTDDRRGYANGFKPKRVKTRVGALDLKVPQTRGTDFYPNCLEKGLRSERALNVAIAEMYIHGVSTRKVEPIVKELCGEGISRQKVSQVAKELDEELEKWRNRELSKVPHMVIDAKYVKVRVDGLVRSCAILIALGVTDDGKRTALGISVSLSEAEIHWRTFLRSLKDRGLRGLQSITSDDHSGLKAALKTEFNGVPWQRCQFHLQRNAQSYVPKQEMKSIVAHDIRSVYNSLDLEEAEYRLNKIIEKYKKTASELSVWLEKNLREGLTIFHFPISIRKRLRTSNWAERTNLEIERRVNVIGIFPNKDSVLRVTSAMLREMSEEWEAGNVYLQLE